MCNSVDISDTTRYFSEKEFSKLGREGRNILNKCPKRIANKSKLTSNKKQKTTTPVSDADRHVAAIINGVMQASRSERDAQSIANTIPTQVQMPQHGSNARSVTRSVNAVSIGAATRSVTYDHNDSIVP